MTITTERVEPSAASRGPRLRGLRPARSASAPRARSIDAIRGLAVLLMVLDHVLLWHPSAHLVRETVTRAAMPLFFVLSGHLVRRISWRHGAVLVVGLFLPAVVPWIDTPNVLVWYVIGAVVVRIVVKDWGRAWLPVIVGLILTQYANLMNLTGWGSSYQGSALIGLMCLGAMLGREWFTWGDRLPAWFAKVGRYPLSVYVGHLLIVEAVVVAWRS